MSWKGGLGRGSYQMNRAAVYLPSGGHYEERVQNDSSGAYHVTQLDSRHCDQIIPQCVNW